MQLGIVAQLVLSIEYCSLNNLVAEEQWIIFGIIAWWKLVVAWTLLADTQMQKAV